jgi:hypothetical protein
MSILRWKQKVMFADGGVLRDSGGGGGSAPSPAGPTQTTVQNTNIPDYAQPYVSNMLNAAQAQIYTPDMTGFNPYVPYSNNPTDYVAGFSPLQQQAQSGAANLQTPGQYGAATGLAGAGAMGALGTAGQAGMAGQRLQQQSTNPYAVSAYMNPFIQNALAPAEQLLNQQYGMQGASQQGAATQAGAFGGSRNALMQGLNEQNRMLAQNQLVGNAYQNAYNQAQQQMNQVANVGLQGQQTALQGYGQAANAANTLAGIGGQQLAAQQGIIGTQAQQGAAQQAQQQNVINQAVQNYATAQQYPMLQLGMLNSMLRGLPMQSTTTSLYQAQPSTAQQAIGLGGTAAMLGAAFKGRTGGLPKDFEVKKMAEGGKVPGYKYGAVINDPQLEDKARKLGAVPAQPGQPSPLQQRIQDPQLNANERMIMQGVQADQNRLRQNPGAAQALMQAAQPPQAQQPNPEMMDQARLSGLGAAGGNAFNSQGFAGGGIIAFADQGLVPEPNSPEAFAARRESMMEKRGFGAGPSAEEQAYVEQLKTRGNEKDLNRSLYLQGAKALADFGSIGAPGGIMQAANMALSKNLPGIASAFDAQRTAQDAAVKAGADLKMAQRKFAAGDVDEAWKDYDSYQKNKTTERVAQIHASVAGQQANAEKGYVQQLVQQGYSLPEALQIVKGAGRAESVESGNAKILLKDINDQIFNLDPKKDADKIAALETQRANIIANLQKGPTASGPQAKQPATNPDAGGIVEVPGKGKFQQLPNGNYIKVG